MMVEKTDSRRYLDWHRVVTDWTDEPLVDPETGLSVASRFVTYLERGGERLVKERTYHTSTPSGTFEKVECVTRTPILDMHDYLRLFDQAGLAATAHGGYEEQPVDEHGRILCFVCQKRSARKSSRGRA
jgi:hypothetical protein